MKKDNLSKAVELHRQYININEQIEEAEAMVEQAKEKGIGLYVSERKDQSGLNVSPTYYNGAHTNIGKKVAKALLKALVKHRTKLDKEIDTL